MKKLPRLLYLAIGILLGSSLAFTSSALADTGAKTLEAVFRNIKIVVDGASITPKDASGNAVEPFIVGGTTYLPVRAVGEALGKEVSWDGTTNTVYIGNAQTPAQVPAPASTQKTYLGFDLKAYQSHLVQVEQSVRMGGGTFGNAIVFSPWSSAYTKSSASFNLNGDYTTISGKIGHVDGSDDFDGVVNIYGDEALLTSVDLSANMFGEDISFSVAGVKQLKIEMTVSKLGVCKYALAEMELIK